MCKREMCPKVTQATSRLPVCHCDIRTHSSLLSLSSSPSLSLSVSLSLSLRREGITEERQGALTGLPTAPLGARLLIKEGGVVCESLPRGPCVCLCMHVCRGDRVCVCECVKGGLMTQQDAAATNLSANRC